MFIFNHKKHLKFQILLLLGIMVIPYSSSSQTKLRKDYPKPEGKNQLFYLQRTLNTNTIVYDLNLDSKEELNLKEPVKIYWIDYSQKGEIEELNFVQRKFAYGVEIKMIDSTKKTFCFNLVSHKKQVIYLMKAEADKKYHAFTYINKKLIDIRSVWIQIDGGSFWAPKIKYVDVVGKDPIKNTEIIERITP